MEYLHYHTLSFDVMFYIVRFPNKFNLSFFYYISSNVYLIPKRYSKATIEFVVRNILFEFRESDFVFENFKTEKFVVNLSQN